MTKDLHNYTDVASQSFFGGLFRGMVILVVFVDFTKDLFLTHLSSLSRA